mgnify:CR=1 FL=1
MAKKYQVKADKLARYPDAVTLVVRGTEKVAVALSGKSVTVTKKASKAGPEITKSVPGATQADLKYLFENEKHRFVEEVDEAGSAMTKT